MESETQSGSRCVFFLKTSAFSNSQELEVRFREGFGVGIGLSYKNLTLTIVTIYIAGSLLNSRLPAVYRHFDLENG